MSSSGIQFSLFHKLVCFGTGMVIVTGILASLVFHSYATRMIRAELTTRGQVLASNLARNSRKGVETGDVFRTLNTLARSVAMEKDVVLVRVLDGRGTVLAEAGNGAVDRDVLAIASPVVSRAELLSASHGPSAEEQAPAIGNVQLYLSLADFRAQIRRATYFAHVLMGVMIVLGLATASVLSRHLTRTIETMAEASVRIGRGEYGVVVPVFTEDELGALASAFNKMSRNLYETSGCLEELVENMLDIVIVVRTDGTIRRVNRVVSAILGYAPGDLAGKHADLLFTDAKASPFRGKAMEQLLREGALRDIEVRFASNEGRLVPARFSAFLAKDEDGRPYAIVGTAHVAAEAL